VLRQTSPDDLFVEEFAFYLYQTQDISCRSRQCIPAKKQPIIIRPTYCKSRDQWNHLQPGCIMSRIGRLTVIHSFVTCSLLYISQDFPLFVIIFLTFSTVQVMAPQTPRAGAIQSGSSRMSGACYNAPLAVIQLQRRQQLVYHDAANAATDYLAYDAQLNKVCTTRHSHIREQLATGCE